jgi:hypothetical protein
MGSSSGSFNIWKYGKDPNDVKNLRSATDLASASSSQHTACDRCHDKKVCLYHPLKDPRLSERDIDISPFR